VSRSAHGRFSPDCTESGGPLAKETETGKEIDGKLASGEFPDEPMGTPVLPTLSRTRPCPQFALYRTQTRVEARMAARRSAQRCISLAAAAGPKPTPQWAPLHLTKPNTLAIREGWWPEILWPRAVMDTAAMALSVTSIASGSSPTANGWLGCVVRFEAKL
jgi:hypothetical protein